MKKYSIIYADPPWHYQQQGNKNYNYGMATRHYATMSTEDICNLPIQKIKTDDAILFLWATFPNIDKALKVVSAWGFEYKTAAFVWIKKTKKCNSNFWGMGAYTRANAEVCLLGVSKNTKAKSQVIRHDISQIVESTIEVHLKKPDIVRDKIVALLGDIPRIELFARQQTKGWDVWGDEVKNSISLY